MSNQGVSPKNSNKAVAFLIDDEDETYNTVRRSFLKHAKQIKVELTHLANGSNLLLILVYVLLLVCFFSSSLQYAATSEESVEIRCNILAMAQTTWNFYEIRNITSPRERSNRTGCHYYDLNYTYLSQLSYKDALEEVQYAKSTPQILKCKTYVYKHNVSIEVSLTKQFDLVCDRSLYRSFNFFAQLGAAIGAFPAGIAADIYGRRPVFIFGAFVATTGGCIIPIAPHLVFLTLGRIILGIGVSAVLITLLVIFTELCRNHYRACLTIISYAMWQAGAIVSHLVLPKIMKWRLVELANACPFLLILLGVAFIPESPRWLMIRGQWETAWTVLQDMGSSETRNIQNRAYPKKTIIRQLKAFAKPYFQYRISISMILTAIGSLTYYIILSIEKRIQQPDDLLIPMSFVQIIAIFLTAGVAYNCSKRSMCCSLFLLLACCLVSSLLVDSVAVNDISRVVAQILTAALYIVTIVYVLEMFPTTHRATTFAMNFTIGRLTILIYLYYQYELPCKLNDSVLRGFFCSFSILCALIAILAPNTYDEITDTQEDFIEELTIAEQISFSF